MKIVPFELAQKLTELGYNKSSDHVYVIADKHLEYSSGSRIDIQRGSLYPALKAWEMLGIDGPLIEAPTYIDVWLWLWREKKFPISLMCDEHPLVMQWYPHSHKTGELGSFTDTVFFDDPEEALVEAIDYIFENNLI